LLHYASRDYAFRTSKPLERLVRISGNNYSDELPEY